MRRRSALAALLAALAAALVGATAPCAVVTVLEEGAVTACPQVRGDVCNGGASARAMAAVLVEDVRGDLALSANCTDMYAQYVCIATLWPRFRRTAQPWHVCRNDCLAVKEACADVPTFTAINCTRFNPCNCVHFGGGVCMS